MGTANPLRSHGLTQIKNVKHFWGQWGKSIIGNQKTEMINNQEFLIK